MKKTLLPAAALFLMANSANAQILTHVDNSALFYIGEGALVYNGGGVQTKGSGIIDIHGNVMVVGNTADTNPAQLNTLDASGNALTTAGNNIILRLNDPGTTSNSNSSYGQLYIDGLDQSKITGYVTKEYLSISHGAFQQMGIPFYNKSFTSLNTELGGGLTDRRWTKSGVLTWNNAKLLSDTVPLAGTTSTTNGSNGWTTYSTKANSYYMVGTAGWNPLSSGTPAKNLPTGATSYNVYSIAGVPIGSTEIIKITETLQNAGNGINYGTGGAARNVYTETYNSYLGDPWAIANKETAWTGNFGRNIYQFGNPYLTNLDLSQIVGNDCGATVNDGNNITNLIGIRYNSSGVTHDRINGSASSSGSTSICNVVAGKDLSTAVPVGDPLPIIKPMGFFVLKLANNTSAQTLNFNTLRRFSSTKRASGTSYDVTAAKVKDTSSALISGKVATGGNTVLAKTSSYVKQIGLIALDASGAELGRTYYAVYPSAESGQSSINTTQASASSSNVIGSFEEKKEGGIDPELQNTYWLYINVANDTDFKGKEIPVRVYSDAVASIKVQLREDGELVADNQSKLSSGESFYLAYGTDTAKEVANGQVLPLASKTISLFYGTPGSGTLAVSDAQKPSETLVVYDQNTSKYVVLFDQTWKSADVMVYDMGGKAILNARTVSAQNPYSLDLPNVSGGYVVTAVSETGAKFVQKIRK